MPVIALSYKKIAAEKEGVMSNVSINTVPKIVNVKKTKLSGLGSDVDILTVDFEFASAFEPKAGKINIEGSIVCRTEDPEKAAKMWETKKTLPETLNVEIINYIFSKVGILALQLSDIMQMPPVIGMPKIEKAKKKDK